MAHTNMKGLSGIIMPRLRLYWIVLVLVILIQCEIGSGSPPYGNRAKRDEGDQDVVDFISNLQTKEVDLVILMERSVNVGRWRFFFRAKKLVSHVLRYYTKIGPSNVRLALVTFAGDVTVHFQGMENIETELLKCDIWNKYWKDVTVDDNPLIWRESEVKMAYEKAKDIFNQYGSSSKKRYIWVLTSGTYDESGVRNPINIRNELVNNMQVEIVATKTGGNEGENGKIILIASSASHHGKEVVDWQTRLKKLPTINDPPSLELFDLGADAYCDKTYGFVTKGDCANHNCDSGECDEDCVCQQNYPDLRICPSISLNYVRVCDMLSGQTGRYCDMDDVECVRNSCANGGTCNEEPRNTFTCNCPAMYDPIFYCEQDCTRAECSNVLPGTNATGAMIGGGVGGGLGLLLIMFFVGGCCIWRKKKRSAQTSDAETYTNADRLEVTREVTTTTTTRGTITILPKFKNNVAPPLPVSLPPSISGPIANPTYRKFPQRPAAPKRPSLKPSIFKWLPQHLWPAQGRNEIDSPNGDIKDDDSDIYNDTESYENAGSKKMPGWDKYVWELAANSDMRNLAIVRYDRSAYVTTCTIWFLPSKQELNHIYQVLKDQQTNVTISIKASSYKVTKNDGRMIEAWLTGRALDVLCVGMSKQYLTLGVKTDPNNRGNCYNEVKFIRDHLSSQGK